MNLSLHATADPANEAAESLLAGWLSSGRVHTLMVAAGNSPLDLYQRIALRKLSLPQLQVFALDEYVGVPLEEPRNCANLLRRTVAEAWNLKPDQFFTISSLPEDPLASVQAQERRIEAAGGLDAIVLGLGQNGHLGFNEPGSAPDSVGRVLDLEAISVEANRQWFGGRYAPNQGVTVGLKTVLAARRVIILAYGTHKTAAVRAMTRGPISSACPASFLQGHPEVHLFLDRAAAGS